MNKKRTIIMLSIVVSLLLTPLIAMQFTEEVKWTLMDFIIAGFILFGAAIGLEYFIRKVQDNKKKIGLILCLVAIVILVWMELAVGIFSSPISGS